MVVKWQCFHGTAYGLFSLHHFLCCLHFGHFYSGITMSIYPSAHPFVCQGFVHWTTQPFVTSLDMAVHHREVECRVTKMGCCLQGQGHSEGLCNQTITVSTISSKLIILLQPVVEHCKPGCPVKEFDHCVQSHSKHSNFWCIYWTTEAFVTKHGVVIDHYQPECHAKKMGCYFQGQSHLWECTLQLKYNYLLYILNWQFFYKQI